MCPLMARRRTRDACFRAASGIADIRRPLREPRRLRVHGLVYFLAQN